MATKLLHSEITYYLRGLGFQIHNALGSGHAESDYETALVFALNADQFLDFRQQPTYRISYRNRQIGQYRPDIVLANNKVLVELKAAHAIEPLHKGQTLSYLKLTGAELGLIMNFGAGSMQFERLPNYLTTRTVTPGQQLESTDLLYPHLSRQILDVLAQVHATLGPGFLHQIYRRATRIELAVQGLSATYLKELPLRYRSLDISMKPVRLFVIENKILLATVALKRITPADTDRMRWALRTIGYRLGLIANFHGTALSFRFLRER